MKKQTAGLFLLGAGGYSLLEIAWRGYTHWTMALTGGAVLVGLARLRERVKDEKPLARCLCGAACITAAEYVVGCTVNRVYHMNVWDYSRERGNIHGQVCPKIRRALGGACRPVYTAQIKGLQYEAWRAYNGVGNMPEKEMRHADRSQCREQPGFTGRL